jgi:predicted TIM-barrel fold metal-dependent hydrolase
MNPWQTILRNHAAKRRHHSDGRYLSRREILSMLSAAGAGMALAPSAFGQGMSKGTGQTIGALPVQPALRIIDTHHHFYPPKFTAELVKRWKETDSQKALRTNWSPKFSLDQMDQEGVETAIGSLTAPGVWLGNDEEGRAWARQSNEYGAQLIKDNPGRFGMWAAIPLPDIDGSLREMEYALDTLKLDGIGLLTSYEDGKLLGDPKYVPVMEELNRRKAVVFVHPTVTCCSDTIEPLNESTIEFPTDTTRTIASLIYRGTFARYQNIRWIFSHGAGTLPMILTRISGATKKMTPEQRAAIIPHGFEGELQRQYYDVASVATNPPAMAAVLKLFSTTHLLFGSDLPYWTIASIVDGLNSLDLPAQDVRMIQRDNALTLLPRLKASGA